MRVRKAEREAFNIVNIILKALADGLSAEQICKKFSGVTLEDVERIVRRESKKHN